MEGGEEEGTCSVVVVAEPASLLLCMCECECVGERVCVCGERMNHRQLGHH